MRRLLIILIIIIPGEIAFTQYFGRNKPGYKVFDYKVFSTPNFEIYHSFTNDSIIKDLALKSEQWYRLHQIFLEDTLPYKNPLIFYENHGDFQQTNVSGSLIGVGLGGFTEGLKNRVVLPLSQTASQTDHVLGHELVHAFQYNYLLNSSGLSLQELGNIPLWMIEGMAEYFSVGSVDPNTAMWLRDDVLNNDLPTLLEMSRNYKYNPYRYGHAFWAFTAKTWGDTLFAPLLSQSAKKGYVKALQANLGVSVGVKKETRNKFKLFKRKAGKENIITEKKLEDFDSLWHSSITEFYTSVMKGKKDTLIGRILFDDKNAGDYNFSPVISPNGNYVIFISEMELFSIDLFLADAHSGKILGRFTKRVNENEIDAFNFIESAGTWSPDSRFFAYSVYKKGKNILLVIDIKKRKVVREIEPEQLTTLTGPSWNPDGKTIAFSAQKDGYTDIYLYHLENNNIQKITTNGHSNIQPSWSFDGKKLVYITEYSERDINTQYLKYSKKISIYNMDSQETMIVDVFPGASNLNPLFSPDNRSVYFLSDRDGFRNMYRYSIDEQKVFQQTDFLTGITGMTPLSPAISISKDSTIVYSYYSKHKYVVYKAYLSEFVESETDINSVNFTAANLPPFERAEESKVDSSLVSRHAQLDEESRNFTALPYRPKFQLDYISNLSVGVSTGFIGPGAAGGATAIFSDIIGNNELLANFNINGTIYDYGGMIAFMNHKRRFNYGAAISHIPYYFGYQGITGDSIEVEKEMTNVINNYFDLYRIFQSGIMFFGYYPFSSTMRLEAAVSASRYGYRLERYNYYYSNDSANAIYYGSDKKVLDAPDPIGYFTTEVAYVIDNSDFGLTAPLRGTRARFQLSKNFGNYDHYATLFDYRKYVFFKPAGIAFRLLNYNRIGNTADKDSYNSLFIGYPWYIRGYESKNFNNEKHSDGDELTINHLIGSKLLVANFEIRIPFTGPEKLSLITSKIFFTDLNFFVDAGIIWDNSSTVVFQWEESRIDKRIPLVSVGTSLRINLFGYMILEPYLAIPFQLAGNTRSVFGLNFVPGW